MTDLPTGTITFLFSDLEGSTRLVRELGSEFDEVLVALFDLQRTAISSAGGVEVRTEGDMIFAVFASAVAGVSAAVEAQRLLDAHDWPGGVSVRVRIGLHTGEGRLAGPDYVGLDVHRAARISSAGHGGRCSFLTRPVLWSPRIYLMVSAYAIWASTGSKTSSIRFGYFSWR